MNASEYIARYLRAQGVTHVFEVIGGMITFMVDALHREGGVQIVSVHHEQGAAFAAEGMGRVSGVPGVAMATSGPGATNLLTGIGSCYFDSVPAVFITGQVNRHEQRGERAIRQLGFQETDIVSMAKPVTKGAWLVNDPESLPEMLDRAFELALSGRPGPVLLDIPMDVQRARIDAPVPECIVPPHTCTAARHEVRQMFEALSAAERPLVLFGGGVQSSRTAALARQFAERLGVPVVHSLMAADVLPAGHPLRVGFIGSYGNRWANHALGRADVLVVVGSRLDVRQTGADVGSFHGGRTIFHVDCEPGEMNNRVLDCHAIHSHLAPFFAEAIEAADDAWLPPRTAWFAEIMELARAWPDVKELEGVQGINPNEFMHHLSAAAASASAYSVDVGQHQMWAAQSIDLRLGQRFLTSGGMGAMGFALPAAMGAAFATPGQPVVMIAGDGGFQLNIQELQTIARNQLPVKMVVLNNQCHGMVRQFQESYFEQRYQSTLWGYSAPDFVRVAAAYGIASARVENPDDVQAALGDMMARPDEPFLLEVMVASTANVYPKIAFGRPITEMEPLAQPTEMEST